jgi:hypothetical protein
MLWARLGPQPKPAYSIINQAGAPVANFKMAAGFFFLRKEFKFGETNYKGASVFPHPQPRDWSQRSHFMCSMAVSSYSGSFYGYDQEIKVQESYLTATHPNSHPILFFFWHKRIQNFTLSQEFLFTCTWENTQSFFCLSFPQKAPPKKRRVVL